MAIINYTLQTVLGTAAELAALNPVLLDGQLGKEVDTNKFKIGNGVLNWNSIEYHITNNTLSVFLGSSIEEGNLLVHSALDGGLTLPKEAINTKPTLDAALAGTLTLADQVEYATQHQHQLATLLIGVYIKRLTNALGTDFQDVLTSGGYAGNSVQTSLTNLQTAVSNLTTLTNGFISDGVEDASHTWSSTKIASEILTAVQDLRTQLVGDAGAALDTIYELAEALGNNSNYITTLLDEVAKGVKFTEQTLTLLQKAQARLNIDAASATLVGDYSEIEDTTLEEHLGEIPADPNDDPVVLAELIDTVASINLKVHMLDCSLYKSNYHSPTGQYLTLTWKRVDNSAAATSVMSNESVTEPGLFETRTETLFAGDGTTPVRTTVFTLSYDSFRNLISEVITTVT